MADLEAEAEREEKDGEWPEDMDEWYDYVYSLSSSKLTDKAYAVNSLKFVELLQEEGYSSQEIEDILFWFAQRLHEEDTCFVPDKGSGMYLSYRTLLRDGGVLDE